MFVSRNITIPCRKRQGCLSPPAPARLLEGGLCAFGKPHEGTLRAIEWKIHLFTLLNSNASERSFAQDELQLPRDVLDGRFGKQSPAPCLLQKPLIDLSNHVNRTGHQNNVIDR